MYPYRRHHFPTWHDLGVLEEAMKEVKRSPLPLDLNYDPEHQKQKQQKQDGQEHQTSSGLPSVMTLLGSCIKHYVEGDEGKPGKFLMNVPVGKHVGPDDVHISCKGLGSMSTSSTSTTSTSPKEADENVEDHNLVIVQVKKEHRSVDGNSRFYREVTRTFNLDQNVDLSQLKSILTPEGFLTFEAPLHPHPHHPVRDSMESQNSSIGDFDFVECADDPDYVD